MRREDEDAASTEVGDRADACNEDRYNSDFIFNGAAEKVTSSFNAVLMAVRIDSARTLFKQEETAVQIPNREKNSMELRCYHDLPSQLAKRLCVWLASPKPTDRTYFLFVADLNDGDDFKKSFEASLLERCVPLTLDQIWADWFILRQFRLTASSSLRILLPSPQVRALFHMEAPYKPTNTPVLRYAQTWLLHGSREDGRRNQ